MTPSLAELILKGIGSTSMEAVATTPSMPKAAAITFKAIQDVTPSSVVTAMTPSTAALAPTP